MKMIKEFMIKNKTFAKIKMLAQLLFSSKYIVISIKNDKSKKNVAVDFHFNVTNDEMKFYTNYLSEYVIKTSSIIANARNILNRE